MLWIPDSEEKKSTKALPSKKFIRDFYKDLYSVLRRIPSLLFPDRLPRRFQKTAERVITMKKVEGTPGSKYQLLNQLLSARRLDKRQEVTEGLKHYLRQEQYVKEMFIIEKEHEK